MEKEDRTSRQPTQTRSTATRKARCWTQLSPYYEANYDESPVDAALNDIQAGIHGMSVADSRYNEQEVQAALRASKMMALEQAQYGQGAVQGGESSTKAAAQQDGEERGFAGEYIDTTGASAMGTDGLLYQGQAEGYLEENYLQDGDIDPGFDESTTDWTQSHGKGKGKGKGRSSKKPKDEQTRGFVPGEAEQGYYNEGDEGGNDQIYYDDTADPEGDAAPELPVESAYSAYSSSPLRSLSFVRKKGGRETTVGYFDQHCSVGNLISIDLVHDIGRRGRHGRLRGEHGGNSLW